MSETDSQVFANEWTPLARVYDPIRVATIDGSDSRPHDRAVIRAIDSKYVVNKDLKSDPKCTLFVARLDFSTTEDTLRKHFSKYGSIMSLRLVTDVVTELSKGYAFIEFKHRSATREAYQSAHNVMIDGRRVLVDYEMGRNLEGWKPRRLGGGFGGKKESGQLRFGCRDRPWKKPIRLTKKISDGHKADKYRDYEEPKQSRLHINKFDDNYRHKFRDSTKSHRK